MLQNVEGRIKEKNLIMNNKSDKNNNRLITRALFIGFLAGIVAYSVFKNSWGLVTLIPLFLMYVFTRPKKAK